MTKKTKLPVSKEAQDALLDAFRHSHYTFPTLTIRQAHILLTCIGHGMDANVYVDGKYVTGDEWIELIKTLINVRD